MRHKTTIQDYEKLLAKLEHPTPKAAKMKWHQLEELRQGCDMGIYMRYEIFLGFVRSHAGVLGGGFSGKTRDCWLSALASANYRYVLKITKFPESKGKTYHEISFEYEPYKDQISPDIAYEVKMVGVMLEESPKGWVHLARAMVQIEKMGGELLWWE